MPKDFTKCVKQGGRVRTIKPRNDVYIRICYDKKGKSHRGEVKHNKGHAKFCMGKCTDGKNCKNRTTTKYCWRHA